VRWCGVPGGWDMRAAGKAQLAGGVPNGISLDQDGTVWCADVPNKRCVRFR